MHGQQNVKKTLHVSDSCSIHHQESSTVHTAIHAGYADCFLASCQHNLYDIYHCVCVQWKTPDDGQRNCPKHVEFYSKNKFEKLVPLVCFIVIIDSIHWIFITTQAEQHQCRSQNQYNNTDTTQTVQTHKNKNIMTGKKCKRRTRAKNPKPWRKHK